MFEQISKDNLIKCAVVSGIAVMAFLSTFLLSKIITEITVWSNSDQIYPAKNITVAGKGEETAVPDIASFTFSVIERADTTEAAQDLATEKSNKALDLLRKSGIADSDIKTQDYNVFPQYNYGSRNCVGFNCPIDSPEIVGYEVNQSIYVKVRNTDDAGRILAELGRVGVSNISGLSFSIDDPEVYKKKARDMAIKDAKEQAQDLADSLGVKLGDIISFSEGSPYPYMDQGFGGEISTMKSSSASPEIPVGENTFTSNVSITFKLD